jgi:hypothetical protein
MKFLSFFFIFILVSCQQGGKKERAKQLGYQLHAYTSGDYKNSQKQFIDTVSKCVHDFLQNNNATIDTNQLHQLFDKAKQANEASYDSIGKTVEVDEDINLRQKAIDENLVYRSLFENEFPKIIQLLENKDLAGLRALSPEINKREEELEKARGASEEASYEFSRKYKLPYVQEDN